MIRSFNVINIQIYCVTISFALITLIARYPDP